MSAQAVLSMIAPALQAAPQGQSGVDASDFQGLFAAVLSSSGAAAPVGEGAPVATGESAKPVDGADLSALTGFLTTPLSLAAAPAALTEGESQEPAPETGPMEVAAATPAGTGAVAPPPPTPAAASAPAPEPSSSSSSPVTPSATPKLTDSAEAPARFEATAPAAPAGPARPISAQAPAPQAALKTAKNAVLQIREGAGSDDGAQAVPAVEDASQFESSADQAPGVLAAKSAATPRAVPPIAPPPLRALAERTSKPLEPTPSTAGPAPAAVATAVGPAPSFPATPADPTSKAAAPAPAAAPQSAEAPPAQSESAPATEPVSGQIETAAPARDHSVSSLSRAAIDATAQIAAQILRKLEGRSTRFEIALRPDELGRVDVKLDIDAEGRLAARLAFDNPAAATDLRGRVDDLRRQLESAGFQLADDAFEFAERDSGSSAFDRGQDSRHGQNRAFAAAARLNAGIDVAQPPTWLALSLSPSGVDMKV